MSRHLANYNDTRTLRHAQRAAYRTAISAAQILVLKRDLITSERVGTLFVTYVGRINILTPHYPPFTLTQGHWNRHESIGYTYDFLLVFYSNYGPI